MDSYNIYEYLLKQDSENENEYLSQQPISDNTRTKIVDLIINLGSDFRTDNLVIHLAIWLFDKFLSIRVIKQQNLQLLGFTCFFIACKYEEVFPPKITDIVYQMQGGNTKNELIQMEVLVLKSVDFYLGTPTEDTFLCILVSLLSEDLCTDSFHLASYFNELSLLNKRSLKFSYSIVAASSLILSQFVLQKDVFTAKKILIVTKIDFNSMHEFILILNSLVATTSESQPAKTIKEKYGIKKYNRVSKLQQPENLERCR